MTSSKRMLHLRQKPLQNKATKTEFSIEFKNLCFSNYNIFLLFSGKKMCIHFEILSPENLFLYVMSSGSQINLNKNEENPSLASFTQPVLGRTSAPELVARESTSV